MEEKKRKEFVTVPPFEWRRMQTEQDNDNDDKKKNRRRSKKYEITKTITTAMAEERTTTPIKYSFLNSTVKLYGEL